MTIILNPVQQEVVEKCDGPLMVLAGAGSGKTRTLVSRIVYLLNEKRISPYRILALTFSNKAAREMRQRIINETSFDMGSLQTTTFHSFCARLLRHEAENLGLSKNFSIYDESDSKWIVRNLFKRLGINPKDLSPHDVLNYIENLKNQGFYQGRSGEFSFDDYFHRFFADYETELHKANALDFGGLITAVIELFEKHPDTLRRYQERYQYLLVDEYQDTNRAQFDLIRMLSDVHQNICVVGDEDQSIYSWRGADIRNILDFERAYPKSETIKLEQNYRSTKVIIKAAAAVIENNRMRKGKVMWTQNGDGKLIEIWECQDEEQEAEFVGKKISQLKSEGARNEDIAVFYRTNAQSRILEDVFRKNNIKFKILGGIKFYERKEIKDLLAYLKMIVNDKDSLAFARVINVPARGIGASTMRKLEEAAIASNMSLWEISSDLIDNPVNYPAIKLTSRMKSSLRQLVSLLSELKLMDQSSVKPSQIYEKVLHESGYYEFIKASKDYESLSRLENLDEFFNVIRKYELSTAEASLTGFLELINLDSSSQDDSLEEEEDKGEISLMTVHGAKGLEFEHVIIVGMEENIFPSFRSLEDGDLGTEEERRLFYVAMTRATKQLFIARASARMQYGQIHFNSASRFLSEIPSHFTASHKMEVASANKFLFSRFDESQESSFDDTPVIQVKRIVEQTEYLPGRKVRHSLYGEGLVVKTEGSGRDEKVLIRFSGGIQKKFLVRMAPLTPL